MRTARWAGGPNISFETFSQPPMDDAKKQGWVVISMQGDWKSTFSSET